MKLNVIVAVSNNFVIGKDGKIPWNIPSDMRYFKEITIGNGNNAVIMGRKTFESIGKALPNRFNIVLSSKEMNEDPTITSCYHMYQALELCKKQNIEDIFVIGGAQIYTNVFTFFYHSIDKIYITNIRDTFEGDTYLKNVPWKHFCLTESKKEENVEYLIYSKQQENRGEYQYLDLVRNTLRKTNLCSFGIMMKFDLQKGFPLLTTKKMFLRGVIEELLWFLSGSTNSNILRDKNVHIWDKNGSREYLDSIGLSHREQGDLGPIYGFNFRHYGAQYKDCHSDYSGQGKDQINNVLHLIKNDPHSRRILINLWNPTQLDEVALPACHVLYQFKVEPENKLSCVMYQRSGDIGLGVPFNIASASLLTHILAKLCHLNVGTLTHCIGDAHIYKEHVISLKKQLERTPFCFPRLCITDTNQKKVEEFKVGDFEIQGYFSHDSISMPLVV